MKNRIIMGIVFAGLLGGYILFVNLLGQQQNGFFGFCFIIGLLQITDFARSLQGEIIES